MPVFLASLLSFLFTEVVIKFIVLGVIFVVITFVLPLLMDFANLTQYTNLFSNFLNQLPDFFHYLLTVFRFDFGLPLFFSALITRWIIKRLPLVG